MFIRVNGKPVPIHAEHKLSDLIEQLELTGIKIAVELNREIVPRSCYGNQSLNDGDVIEIVQAIGGG